MLEFYAYLWLREDGTPYYAGKGKGKRAFTSVGHGALHCPKDDARIVIFPQDSETAAFEFEVALIKQYGRKDLGTGCLRNLTGGGEGISGYVWVKPKTAKAMKAALENIKKATAAITGKPKTPEQRQRYSDALRGLPRSKEHSQHISDAKKGKKVPKLLGEKNARWGKPPTNVDALRKLNASRPRDARGRFFND